MTSGNTSAWSFDSVSGLHSGHTDRRRAGLQGAKQWVDGVC